MTKEIPGMQKILDFIECYKDHGLGSTGFVEDNFAGILYNVEGSNGDHNHIPDESGKSWKDLLLTHNVPGPNCYVTEPLPLAPPAPEKTHAQFNAGGHMTTDPNGQVENGSCYLMPLCTWHNSTRRNRVAFSHVQTHMLRLNGYLQGELAATFQLRLPSKEPYAILYYSEEGWTHQNLSKEQAMNLRTDFLPKMNSGEEVNYVLFERVHEPQTMHYIREVNLPGSES